jgi:hypothetical protein
MTGYSFDEYWPLTAFPLAVIVVIVGVTVSLARWGRASMNGSTRAPEVYGYTVCLIAVVVALISVSGLLDAAFTVADPLDGDSSGAFREMSQAISLRSLDAFRTSATKTSTGAYIFRHQVYGGNGVTAIADTLTDAQVQARYETLRADRLSVQRFKAIKGFVTNTIMLVFALALFAWHWRWLRRPAS